LAPPETGSCCWDRSEVWSSSLKDPTKTWLHEPAQGWKWGRSG
jgi:hypothetical protein